MKFKILALLVSMLTARGDLLPALYDTVTKQLVIPTNISGMKFGGLTITNLAGYGLTVSNGVLMVDTNVITSGGGGGGSGTMTGIAFSVPAPFAISPASTTTTNTFTLSVSNQTANQFYSGPTSGGAAAPGFRGVVDDDIPNTITIDLATTASTANSGDSATAFFSSGFIERARGGTSADTSAFGAGLIGSDGSNNTIDVDTEGELETALGGIDLLVIATDDVSSANLRTAISDETGTGAAVFAGGDIGAATATTPAANDSDTSVATTAYVQAEEAALIGANLWQATNANLTTLAGASITGSGSFMRTRTGVPREIWIPANAMSPGTDAPTASTNTWATTTDGQRIETWDFSAASTNTVQWTLTLPQAWDGSTVKAKVFWKQVVAEVTSTNVWAIGGGSINDAETGGNTLGTLVTVADVGANDTNVVSITSASSAITIGGTPSPGHLTWFSLSRHPGNTDDNSTVLARLLGVHLQFIETSTEPTAW